MNKFLVGLADKTAQLLETKQPFLLIDDGEIADTFLEHFPNAKQFDTTIHSFNPLRGIDYKTARNLASTVYTASPEGKDTLTVRNGKRALTRLLLNTTRLDRIRTHSTDPATVEAVAAIDDILLSPVLRKVFCNPTNFSFKGSIIAKIDRAELGDFDAFILASILIGQFKGQVIVPDFGFYGRVHHLSLIRQNRLTAGLSFMSEVPVVLQQALLSIKDKVIYRTTVKDAEELIVFTKHTEPRNIYDQTGNEYLTS